MITCSLTETEVCKGTIQFTVTATDPEGDLITLRPLMLKGGLEFPEIEAHSSPATANVTWRLDEPGPVSVSFVAHDTAQPQIKSRFTLRLYVADCATKVMADVTGDGLPDMIGSSPGQTVGPFEDAGEIYIWPGGATSVGAPGITLHAPGVGADERLLRAGVDCVDLTGDGIPDVVGIASGSDASGVPDGGAVFVWEGGPNLNSSSVPIATLVRPGEGLDSIGVQVHDVTGNGVPDIIVSDINAQSGPSYGLGAYYIFEGGATMTGVVAPKATLENPLGGSSARMYQGEFWEVTGDGFVDLIGRVNGVTIIFEGGPGLVGVPGPKAILTPQPISADQNLGYSRILADLTGDGILDIVLGQKYASFGGVTLRGGVYFWPGGPGLVGSLGPTARLRDPDAVAYDQMGLSGLAVQDVTGDGVLDVIAASGAATVGGVAKSGAIWIWEGGTTFSGIHEYDTKLTLPTHLEGQSLSGHPQYGDITGNGLLDIVSFCETPDGSGKIGVWHGGSDLLQGPDPMFLATGWVTPTGFGWPKLKIDDLNGDGVDDVLTRGGGYSIIPISTSVHYGRRVLQAGAEPDARFSVPGAVGNDSNYNRSYIVEVTGDDKPDLVEIWPGDDGGGLTNLGATHVWFGGQHSGVTAPSVTLRDPAGHANDLMGRYVNIAKPGTLFRDIDGDGIADILVDSIYADGPGGVVNTGKALLWTNLNTLSGTPAPTATLQVQNALPSDELAAFLRIGDWDMDGLKDIFAGSSYVDVSGVPDVGALHFFRGSDLNGTVAPATTLAVPWAIAGARLYFGI